MSEVIRCEALTRRYGATLALDHLDLSVGRGEVVGLIGRNGSGKTTLLDHVTGLRLPTSGSCATFGRPTPELGADELARLGAVPQEGRLLGWMSVEQHLRYVEAFYPRWDREREARLVDELELSRKQTILKMSPGNVQKLALILAVCHHPELLLLDEPLASIDPIARESLLRFLLELVREDGTTVVASSHVLRDVERIVGRVVCLEGGRLVVDAELDELLEGFGEWELVASEGELPGRFEESFVLAQRLEGSRARLVVRASAGEERDFAARHRLEVRRHPMNLEAIFPHLVGRGGER